MARALSRAAASAMLRLISSASSASLHSSIHAVSSVSPRNFHNLVRTKYLFPSVFQSRAFAVGAKRKASVVNISEDEDEDEFVEDDSEDDCVRDELLNSEDAISDDDFKTVSDFEKD